jgi:hypothetical protein
MINMYMISLKIIKKAVNLCKDKVFKEEKTKDFYNQHNLIVLKESIKQLDSKKGRIHNLLT